MHGVIIKVKLLTYLVAPNAIFFSLLGYSTHSLFCDAFYFTNVYCFRWPLRMELNVAFM